MKVLKIESDDKGFTLVELMIVLAIVSILASVAGPLFASSRQKACDTTAKVDLKNAMKFLDSYFLDNNTFPETSDDLLAAGFDLSKNVSFTRYSLDTFGDGQPTVHMHVKHAAYSNAWHANYPKEGTAIEIR
jgi:prepilin-type N-terminal cleavage/methylation domain-containing protein